MVYNYLNSYYSFLLIRILFESRYCYYAYYKNISFFPNDYNLKLLFSFNYYNIMIDLRIISLSSI